MSKTIENLIDDVAKKLAERFATQFKNEIYKEIEKINVDTLKQSKTITTTSTSSSCGSLSYGSCGSVARRVSASCGSGSTSTINYGGC